MKKVHVLLFALIALVSSMPGTAMAVTYDCEWHETPGAGTVCMCHINGSRGRALRPDTLCWDEMYY